MAKQRQVQHRPDREKARGRELAEANKEIRQLKRLVSRQQKTIRKMENERGITVELEEASPEPTTPRGEPQPVVLESQRDDDSCSKCGGTVWTTFTTPGGKTIKGCKNCKARR
jgi:hypothetical protein